MQGAGLGLQPELGVNQVVEQKKAPFATGQGPAAFLRSMQSGTENKDGGSTILVTSIRGTTVPGVGPGMAVAAVVVVGAAVVASVVAGTVADLMGVTVGIAKGNAARSRMSVFKAWGEQARDLPVVVMVMRQYPHHGPEQDRKQT